MRMPFFRKAFLEFGGDFFVLERHDARQRFEDRHLRAEGVKDGGEFDAHGAASHHHERLWESFSARGFRGW